MTHSNNSNVLVLIAILSFGAAFVAKTHAGLTYSGCRQFRWDPGDTTTVHTHDWRPSNDFSGSTVRVRHEVDPFVWKSFHPVDLITEMEVPSGTWVTAYYRNLVHDTSHETALNFPSPYKSFVPGPASPTDAYNIRNGYWPSVRSSGESGRWAGSDFAPAWYHTVGILAVSDSNSGGGVGVGTVAGAWTSFAWLADQTYYDHTPPVSSRPVRATTLLFDERQGSVLVSPEKGVVGTVHNSSSAAAPNWSLETPYDYDGNFSLHVPEGIGEAARIDGSLVGSSATAVNIELSLFFNGSTTTWFGSQSASFSGTIIEKAGEYSIGFDSNGRLKASLWDVGGREHVVYTSSQVNAYHGIDSNDWIDLGFMWDGHVAVLLVNAELSMWRPGNSTPMNNHPLHIDFEKPVTDSDVVIKSLDIGTYWIDELRITNEVLYYDQIRFDATMKTLVVPEPSVFGLLIPTVFLCNANFLRRRRR